MKKIKLLLLSLLLAFMAFNSANAAMPIIGHGAYAACFFGGWAGGGGAVEVSDYCKSEWL